MGDTLDQRVAACRESPNTWRVTGQEQPVFVDDSGRRARGVHLAGFAMATLCAFWLGALVVGMVGFSGMPALRSPVAAHVSFERPLGSRTEEVALSDANGVEARRDRRLVALSERSRSECAAGRAVASSAFSRRRAQVDVERLLDRQACAARTVGSAGRDHLSRLT